MQAELIAGQKLVMRLKKLLPWLILTDKNRVVTVEGFSINELEEKLNQ